MKTVSDAAKSIATVGRRWFVRSWFVDKDWFIASLPTVETRQIMVDVAPGRTDLCRSVKLMSSEHRSLGCRLLCSWTRVLFAQRSARKVLRRKEKGSEREAEAESEVAHGLQFKRGNPAELPQSCIEPVPSAIKIPERTSAYQPASRLSSPSNSGINHTETP